MQNNIAHKPRNGWDVYASEDERKKIHELADKYIDFLSSCKTERETVNWVRARLEEAGFAKDVTAPCFFETAKDKTVVMARKGRRSLQHGVRIVGAHADTPRLDFKQHPLYEACDLALAKTHYYGGIRKYQWLSRPLALHGVVVKADGACVEICIGEDPVDPVLVITDLLPHLAYKQNEQKVSDAFEAEKLNVLLGNTPSAKAETGEDKSQPEQKERFKTKILELLYQRYGLIEEDLYSAELQIVPAGQARSAGLDGSLVGGYGQDDRICVFAAFEAFLAETEPEQTQIVIFWDKEEIGSEGATGAKSLFLEYTLKDLVRAWEPDTDPSLVLRQARALSADVHGSIDPDYQDLHDALNSSKLGYGPVFCKFTGHRGKVGSSEATAEYVAWLRNMLNTAGIPWQMAGLGKVDSGGGGTVAKFLAVYGMDIIDFGPGVLGMHSPFEVSSKVDLYATCLAFREFLR
ncbi:MAG: aminopeptidase [Desulfohalobiaceae bacterium]|nr:aminopeptidase [Desulfohalobiaceae bacterium]